MLRRLHSWLLNPASALHSPLLLSVIDTAVAKTFLQLLAELRALDTAVVAASPASIIIATRKHTVAAAAAYVRFLTDTLAARPLFAWLSLPPTRVWATLLWRDDFNYAGVRVPLAALDPAAAAAASAASPSGAAALAAPPQPPRDDGADLEDDMEGEEGEEAAAEAEAAAPADAAAAPPPPPAPDIPGCSYEAHWNLREFLPGAVHKYFDDVVERFVTRPWRTVHADAGPAPVRPRHPLASSLCHPFSCCAVRDRLVSCSGHAPMHAAMAVRNGQYPGARVDPAVRADRCERRADQISASGGE